MLKESDLNRLVGRVLQSSVITKSVRVEDVNSSYYDSHVSNLALLHRQSYAKTKPESGGSAGNKKQKGRHVPRKPIDSENRLQRKIDSLKIKNSLTPYNIIPSGLSSI